MDPQDSNPFTPTEEIHQPPLQGSGQPELPEDVKKGLNGAKWAMIIVGVLTLVVNIFLMVNAAEEMKQVVQQEGLDGDLGMFTTILRVFYGIAAFLGIVYIILGLLVYRFPLFAPLTGLILYIGSVALFGFLEPTSLMRGIILKIFVVVALFNAVKAGFEYRRVQREAYDQMFRANAV